MLLQKSKYVFLINVVYLIGRTMRAAAVRAATAKAAEENKAEEETA